MLACNPMRADLILQPHDIVAICGDSITQQKQYSVFMEDYFLMCQPAEKLRAAQFGWNGEQAAGLNARINNDVLPFKPTVATICYGMNDGHYRGMTPATGDAYRQNVTEVVEKLKAGGVRAIIVGTPGAVDAPAYTNPGGVHADEYNKTLGALGDIAREVAQKEGVGFADVHTPMMDVMAKAHAAYGTNYIFIPHDGVHPQGSGHIVMAYAFLKAMGCDGAIGTITVDLSANKAEGTPGQTIQSCQNGSVEIESSRYPFCFQGDPDKPDPTSASMLKFLPFNEDLNRYMLVVKGLKGTKAKVTWGTVSKEFPATDLAKGINLAGEFLANPFRDQFSKVDAAVQAQQAQETTLVISYLHNLPTFQTMLTDTGKGYLDKVTADAMSQEENLFNAAAALVVPVHHTIKIEDVP